MRARGRVGGIILGLIVLIAAAGCGGSAQPASSVSGQKGAPPPSSASKPASAPAKKLTQVVIGKAVNAIVLNGAEIAEREGFMKQQGLTVKSLIMHGSSNADAALVGGSLQFTGVDSIPLAIARSKGVPLLSVVGVNAGITIMTVLSKAFINAHHLSATASLAARVRGLEGARIGHAGPTDLGLIEMLFKRYGVPMSSVKIETFGNGAAERAALLHGSIDSFSISPPTSLQVVAQGKAERWIDFSKVPGMDKMQFDIIVTSAPYAKAHPKIMRGFATAYAEANNFIVHHPNQTLKIEESLWPKISPQVVKQTLGLIAWQHNGLQSQTGWDQADTIINKLGFVKGGNFKAVQGVDWTNQYIDTAALQGG